MIDRESMLPLTLGLCVAAAAHLLAIAWSGHLDGALFDRHPQRPTEPALTDASIKLGQDLPRPATVAWIDHEAFEQLMAQPSPTEQPALQDQADPVPGAPMRMEAAAPQTEPTPNAAASPSHSPAAQSEGGAVLSLADLGVIPVGPISGDSGEDLPLLVLQSVPPTEPLLNPSATAPSASNDTTKKPTGATRSDRQSPPVKRKDKTLRIHPGQVLTGQGIEIKTVHPRFDVVARTSSMPTNPTVRLSFDRTGRVYDAKIVRSSGYANVDGPILSSLYKWRASGKKLQELDGPFRLEFQILLRRR